MTTSSRFLGVRPLVWILTLVLTLGLASNMQAAHPGKNKLADDSAEAGMLRQAYSTLSVADHDYKGHRVRAMHQIEEAAKKLGVNLRGDGHVRENQHLSDEDLRSAIGLLQQAGSVVGGQGLKHIEAAIAQLNIALSIK